MLVKVMDSFIASQLPVKHGFNIMVQTQSADSSNITQSLTGQNQKSGFGRKIDGYIGAAANGVIHIDFFKPDITMNSKHYIAAIKTFTGWLSSIEKQKEILVQHNAGLYISCDIQEEITKLVVTVFSHLL